MKEVNLYTDGSSLGNPGASGYCALLEYFLPSGEPLYIQKSGGEKYSTNGRMELKAVVEGLSLLREPCVVTIICDSKYVCDSIDVYLQGWIDKGFKDVKHTDLWGEYMRLTSQNKIITKWVKAHSGHSQNEHCDRVAKENARYYQ